MPDIQMPQEEKLVIHIKEQSQLDAKIDGIFQTPKSKTDTNLSPDESLRDHNLNQVESSAE